MRHMAGGDMQASGVAMLALVVEEDEIGRAHV
jgi:hypothetical protein